MDTKDALSMRTKNRNEYLDIVRGIAIILMVFGHCVQYGNGTEFSRPDHFFNNKVFQIIYSFHMPLFMMVSGYFYSHTLGKCDTFVKFFKNRFSRIMLPIIGWQVVEYFIKSVTRIYRGEFSSSIVIEFICSWVKESWFLWAILYCSIGIWLVRKWFNDSIWIYLLVFGISFYVPDVIYNLEYYKFMYPFFVTGYLFAENIKKEKMLLDSAKIKRVFVLASIAYLGLFLFWSYDAYIYTSGYTLLWKEKPIYQFVLDIYRMLIGYAGSVMTLTAIWLLYHTMSRHNKITIGLAEIGRESLGIYIISGRLIGWILIRSLEYFSFSYINNIIQTVGIIGISFLITKAIREIPGVRYVLLGGR